MVAQALVPHNARCDFRHWSRVRQRTRLPAILCSGDSDARRIHPARRAAHRHARACRLRLHLRRCGRTARLGPLPRTAPSRSAQPAHGHRRRRQAASRGFGVEEYIANVTPFFAQNAFFEVETAQRVERFGQVAHVWSRYEARTEPDGGALPQARRHPIQVFNDGTRWWIVPTIWDNERDGLRFDLLRWGQVHLRVRK